MRLALLEHGHDEAGRAMLDELRRRRGAEPTDVLRILCYRHEFFGGPFSAYVDRVLRDRSPWSPGERELFATFVSAQNQCPF